MVTFFRHAAVGAAVLGGVACGRDRGVNESTGIATASQPLAKSVSLPNGLAIREAAWMTVGADRIEVRLLVTNPTKSPIQLDIGTWRLRAVDGELATLATEVPAKAKTVRIEPNGQWRGSLLFATSRTPSALKIGAPVDVALGPVSSPYPSTSVVAR